MSGSWEFRQCGGMRLAVALTYVKCEIHNMPLLVTNNLEVQKIVFNIHVERYWRKMDMPVFLHMQSLLYIACISGMLGGGETADMSASSGMLDLMSLPQDVK